MLKTKYKYSSLDRCWGKGLLQLALRANSELSSSFPKQVSAYVFSYVYAQWYKLTYSAHVLHSCHVSERDLNLALKGPKAVT